MGKFRFILWDIDDTLLDFGKSEDYAIRACFQEFGLNITTEIISRYSEINLSYWKKLELGEVDKLTVLRRRFIDLFAELGIAGIDIEAFRGCYQENLGSVFFFRDEADILLEKLTKDYRQFAVTNGVAKTQHKKLKLSGMDRLMENVFISEEIGAEKPSALFFERAFAEIPDFEKDAAILIGDSLTSDMRGAKNAGIASCWYNPAKQENTAEVQPDYEIDYLWKIEEIL